MFGSFSRKDTRDFAFGKKPKLPYEPADDEFEDLLRGEEAVIEGFLERRMAMLKSPDLSPLKDLFSDYHMKCMRQSKVSMLAMAHPNTPLPREAWDDGTLGFPPGEDIGSIAPVEGFESEWGILVEFFQVMRGVRIGEGNGSGYIWPRFGPDHPFMINMHGMINLGKVVPLYWDVCGDGIAMASGGRIYLNHVSASDLGDLEEVSSGLAGFVEHMVNAIRTRGVLWANYFWGDELD